MTVPKDSQGAVDIVQNHAREEAGGAKRLPGRRDHQARHQLRGAEKCCKENIVILDKTAEKKPTSTLQPPLGNKAKGLNSERGEGGVFGGVKSKKLEHKAAEQTPPVGVKG